MHTLPYHFPSVQLDPRVLLGEMMKKLPDGKTIKEDLVPGGDLRSKGNGWLRSAFTASGMKKVPREGQMRLAVKKLIGKKNGESRQKLAISVFYDLLRH